MFNRLLNWIASKSQAHRELQIEHHRDQAILRTYASALREITIAGDNVKTPNGTTRKLCRISRQAFENAAKIVCGPSDLRGAW